MGDNSKAGHVQQEKKRSASEFNRKRPVSAAEARMIAGRYNDSHFGHKAEHARYTIPADPERDDDFGLERFIAQYEAMAEALLTIANADCNCDRGYPGSCGCGDKARERADDALEIAGLCRDCSGTGAHKIRVRGGDIDERNCHCAAGQARWAQQEAVSPSCPVVGCSSKGQHGHNDGGPAKEVSHG